MRKIETEHENMSPERVHGGPQPKPSGNSSTSGCGGPKPPNQPGARSDGGESDDEDYAPPEMVDSDDGYSTVCDEGSDDDGGSHWGQGVTYLVGKWWVWAEFVL